MIGIIYNQVSGRFFCYQYSFVSGVWYAFTFNPLPAPLQRFTLLLICLADVFEKYLPINEQVNYFCHLKCVVLTFHW